MVKAENNDLNVFLNIINILEHGGSEHTENIIVKGAHMERRVENSEERPGFEKTRILVICGYV